jgi:hypothetical protein
MAQTPPISSIAVPHDLPARADGFAIAIASAIRAAGFISIKSITPKTITTKR